MFTAASVSLPVRKSCGIVDCFLPYPHQQPCVTPHPLNSLLLPPPPLRLDTDGIDLLMSFLKVSLAVSASHQCEVKSSLTFCSYARTVFLERNASGRVNTLGKHNAGRASFLFLSFDDFVSGTSCQYESKKRISADEAMRQPYFRSLGPRVHTLPESE